MTEQDPQIPALLVDLSKATAMKKIVSLLYLVLGKTGRTMLMGKHPATNIFIIELKGLLEQCLNCFKIRRHKTSDRQAFLSRMQLPCKSLHQFWNVVNGLAAKCDFGNQTQRSGYDIFILNMSNKQVQEKVCTDPKDDPAQRKNSQLPLKIVYGNKKDLNTRIRRQK